MIARYLSENHGVGLRPVAAFGDADWDVPSLPVTRRLEQAWSHMGDLGVRHTIGYDEVLRRAERSLQYVWFVPDLHGVPAASVVATPLRTTLGLQP